MTDEQKEMRNILCDVPQRHIDKIINMPNSYSKLIEICDRIVWHAEDSGNYLLKSVVDKKTIDIKFDLLKRHIEKYWINEVNVS